MVHELILTRA